MHPQKISWPHVFFFLYSIIFEVIFFVTSLIDKSFFITSTNVNKYLYIYIYILFLNQVERILFLETLVLTFWDA